MTKFSSSINFANHSYEECVQLLSRQLGVDGFKGLRIALDWEPSRIIDFLAAAGDLIFSKGRDKWSYGELALLLATTDRKALWNELDALSRFIAIILETSSWDVFWRYLIEFGFWDSFVKRYDMNDDLLVRCGAFDGPGYIPIYISCSWVISNFTVRYPPGKFTLSVIRRSTN